MRIVIVLRKNNGKQEVYTSVLAFMEDNEDLCEKNGYTQAKINEKISRRKEPFEDDNIKITRADIIGRKMKRKKTV